MSKLTLKMYTSPAIEVCALELFHRTSALTTKCGKYIHLYLYKKNIVRIENNKNNKKYDKQRDSTSIYNYTSFFMYIFSYIYETCNVNPTQYTPYKPNPTQRTKWTDKNKKNHNRNRNHILSN